MPDHLIEPPAQRSQTKATIALVLGIISIVCLVSFILLFVFSEDRLDGIQAYWLLFPTVSFCTGGVAAFLGAIGWADVRRGAAAEGLRRSQYGAILGGISAGILTLCTIALIIFFVILVASFNEGVD